MSSTLRNSAFKRPTSSQSFQQDGWINSILVPPLGESPGFSVECLKMVTSAVIGLFSRRSPFYISRTISFVIIDSFNRMFVRRSIAKVFKEKFKGCHPFGAYFNPSAPVSMERRVFRISTSRFYTFPCFILNSMTHPMCFLYFACCFRMDATTRLCEIASEIARIYNGFVSAITLTIPSGVPILVVSGTCNNGESSKSLSGKIDQVRHEITSWLKVFWLRDDAGGAVNQLPLFGRATLSSKLHPTIFMEGLQA